MAHRSIDEDSKASSQVLKDLICDPAARLQCTYDSAQNLAKVDPNIPAHRYYRSGIEIMRMAKVYLDEGALEKAYILCIKYLTIFLENIRKHPQYNAVPAKDKALNQASLRQVFPMVEKLRKDLLEEYRIESIKAAEQKERQKSEPVAPKEKEHQPEPSDNSEKSVIPAPQHRKHGLRDIVVPARIVREFLTLASINTTNNKETCGILAGKLENDRLLVTHLLIPKQSGSSDSCATSNEEDIFDYQDQHGLITLGWIHTHPTQTAFLSSVDLHTHCSYQLMMAEAIAIVCAPKYDETGYFTLTPEHGLSFVAHCRETGFHPHPNEKSLYTHAQHCILDAGASLKVVDLRKK